MPRQPNGIYTSPYGTQPSLTPTRVWDAVCRRYPDSRPQKGQRDYGTPMLNDVVAGGRSYSFDEVETLTTALAAGLIEERGVRAGDVVLLVEPSSAAFLIHVLAIARAGAVPALANPAYTKDELRHTASLVRARAVACHPSTLGRVLEAGVPRSDVWQTAEPPRLGGEGAGEGWWSCAVDDREAAKKICDERGSGTRGFEDTFGIFFSSGTTGLPKAVTVSNRALMAEYVGMRGVPGNASPQPEPTCVCLPCFHVAGFLTFFFTAVQGDTTFMCITNPFDMKLVIGTLKKYEIKNTTWVPPLLVGLVASGLATPQLLPQLRRIVAGAAPLGAALHAEATRRLDVPIVQVWGSTETVGAATCGSPAEAVVPGSAGKALPGIELRLVDEEGRDVDEGKPGEILVRGRSLMTEYLYNDKATAEALDKDGWYHTGDIGLIKPSDDVFIIDRIKELIKYKGLQVAPAELEDLILTHPGVADVGVIGVWDEAQSTELPRAYVCRRAGYGGKDEELERDVVRLVEQRLSQHKRLRGGAKVIDAIPKNPSGKILRRILRDQAKAEAAAAAPRAKL